ncbi:hypothetical protein VOLCADRAFT_118351 [Volvox carteri f. nagariensis]|uniref:AMP-dependent synthetase/ligase domain-containing protein n=1 Tax=Volvox carteri f. nagariensis TaxID=3068 RepID=D8U4F4_VOLCA|nr:uncharacterized protein VOLCADRAFT_118351 [Volvox carteri f. nagariensis]EFJ45492.1 hypothetical protein VOLCADRAFT_118351 [Volvox carteri f. nagariensis]|eukprot:XP_002953519.1 hypothetical protein VOLCADRAFT_118351 [Volvox carteri f. nagariensis]
MHPYAYPSEIWARARIALFAPAAAAATVCDVGTGIQVPFSALAQQIVDLQALIESWLWDSGNPPTTGQRRTGLEPIAQRHDGSPVAGLDGPDFPDRSEPEPETHQPHVLIGTHVAPSGSGEGGARGYDCAPAAVAAAVVEGPSLVAVFCPASLDYIRMTLAVLAAGAAFLPLDPEWPAPRVAAVVRLARPTLLLTNSAHEHLLPQELLLATCTCKIHVAPTAAAMTAVTESSARPLSGLEPPPPPQQQQQQHSHSRTGRSLAPKVPPPEVNTDRVGNGGGRSQTPVWLDRHPVRQLAMPYFAVLYTSGSTGEPLGVCMSAAAWLTRIAWMQRRYPLRAPTSESAGLPPPPLPPPPPLSSRLRSGHGASEPAGTGGETAEPSDSREGGGGGEGSIGGCCDGSGEEPGSVVCFSTAVSFVDHLWQLLAPILAPGCGALEGSEGHRVGEGKDAHREGEEGKEATATTPLAPEPAAAAAAAAAVDLETAPPAAAAGRVAGPCSVLIPPPGLAALQPERFVCLLAEYGVSHLVSVPSLLRHMLPALRTWQHRLGRLRLLVSSGEPLAGDLAAELAEALPQSVRLLNLYGWPIGDTQILIAPLPYDSDNDDGPDCDPSARRGSSGSGSGTTAALMRPCGGRGGSPRPAPADTSDTAAAAAPDPDPVMPLSLGSAGEVWVAGSCHSAGYYMPPAPPPPPPPPSSSPQPAQPTQRQPVRRCPGARRVSTELTAIPTPSASGLRGSAAERPVPKEDTPRGGPAEWEGTTAGVTRGAGTAPAAAAARDRFLRVRLTADQAQRVATAAGRYPVLEATYFRTGDLGRLTPSAGGKGKSLSSGTEAKVPPEAISTGLGVRKLLLDILGAATGEASAPNIPPPSAVTALPSTRVPVPVPFLRLAAEWCCRALSCCLPPCYVVAEAGCLHLLGRVDRQVKVGGVRLDLGEVEALLAAHPAVREAAVVTATSVKVTAEVLAEAAKSAVTGSEPRHIGSLRLCQQQQQQQRRAPLGRLGQLAGARNPVAAAAAPAAKAPLTTAAAGGAGEGPRGGVEEDTEVGGDQDQGHEGHAAAAPNGGDGNMAAAEVGEAEGEELPPLEGLSGLPRRKSGSPPELLAYLVLAEEGESATWADEAELGGAGRGGVSGEHSDIPAVAPEPVAAALRTWLAGRLALRSGLRLRFLVLSKKLPRNPAGKIMRRQLPPPPRLAPAQSHKEPHRQPPQPQPPAHMPLKLPISESRTQPGGQSLQGGSADPGSAGGGPPPRPAGEGTVMRAVVAVTGLTGLEATTDIFAAGASSLDAVQVAALLGTDVRLVLSYPTPRALAAALRSSSGGAGGAHSSGGGAVAIVENHEREREGDWEDDEMTRRGGEWQRDGGVRRRVLQGDDGGGGDEEPTGLPLKRRRLGGLRPQPLHAPLVPPAAVAGPAVATEPPFPMRLVKKTTAAAAATIAAPAAVAGGADVSENNAADADSSSSVDSGLDAPGGGAAAAAAAAAIRALREAVLTCRQLTWRRGGTADWSSGGSCAGSTHVLRHVPAGGDNGDDGGDQATAEAAQVRARWRYRLGRCVDAPVLLVNLDLRDPGSRRADLDLGQGAAFRPSRLTVLLACSHDGDVACLDEATGVPYWHVRLPARAEAGMAIAWGPTGRSSVSGGGGGGCGTAAAATSAKLQLSDATEAATALILHGLVPYIHVLGQLLVFATPSIPPPGVGTASTSKPPPPPPPPPSQHHHSHHPDIMPYVLVACGDGVLYSLDLADGSVKGAVDCGGEFKSPPVCDPWVGAVWATGHSRQLSVMGPPNEVLASGPHIERLHIGAPMSVPVTFTSTPRPPATPRCATAASSPGPPSYRRCSGAADDSEACRAQREQHQAPERGQEQQQRQEEQLREQLQPREEVAAVDDPVRLALVAALDGSVYGIRVEIIEGAAATAPIAAEVATIDLPPPGDQRTCDSGAGGFGATRRSGCGSSRGPGRATWWLLQLRLTRLWVLGGPAPVFSAPLVLPPSLRGHQPTARGSHDRQPGGEGATAAAAAGATAAAVVIIVGHVDGSVRAVQLAAAHQHHSLDASMAPPMVRWTSRLRGNLFADLAYLPPPRRRRCSNGDISAAAAAAAADVPTPSAFGDPATAPPGTVPPGGEGFILAATHAGLLYGMDSVYGTTLWLVDLACGPISAAPALALSPAWTGRCAAASAGLDSVMSFARRRRPEVADGASAVAAVCASNGALLLVRMTCLSAGVGFGARCDTRPSRGQVASEPAAAAAAEVELRSGFGSALATGNGPPKGSLEGLQSGVVLKRHVEGGAVDNFVAAPQHRDEDPQPQLELAAVGAAVVGASQFPGEVFSSPLLLWRLSPPPPPTPPPTAPLETARERHQAPSPEPPPAATTALHDAPTSR